MRRRYFPAVIDREGSLYGITFPDFPGCVSSGGSPEEAIEAGREALSGHVALMAADGDPLPDPTRLEEVTWEEDEDVVCISLVSVTLPGKAVRVNITLDAGLLEEIDAVTSNRSAFLAGAARAALHRQG